MTVTGIDPARPGVVALDLAGEDLLTLDALADAATRLDPKRVQHHLGHLPVVSPEGRTKMLPLQPGDVVRGLATNGCWVMLRTLGSLPEYRALLERHARAFELALRARNEPPTAHNLVAFLAAPGATVPVHYDRNHHLLTQVRGTKTVGVGRFSDPREQVRQLERGMLAERLNAGALPDDREEFVLHPGDALVLPAFTFHWVTVGDDVSIALTFTATTAATARAVDVYSFNVQARRLGLRPAGPGNERNDRWKQGALSQARRMKSLTRRG
jgi:quercetin dioxygenase-like cupin family protein